jgi:protocatechuate 3,4-dioxygenase beta subunit
MKRPRDNVDELTRRRALTFLAGAGAVLAVRCGASSHGPRPASAADGSAGEPGDAGRAADALAARAGAVADAEAGCAATPEGEIGPYFAEDSDPRFDRSNILSNLDGTNVQTGIPLALTVIVVDTGNGCAPYANAQVDIWHCNAAGIYSDQAAEGTTSETWLRGYQVTGADGRVTFVTIVPGWYAGRATHIHLRVRSSYNTASSTTDGTNTTQAFFDQTFVDRLATRVTPYSAEGKNPTTNAADRVYAAQTEGLNVLSLTGDDTSGYFAALTIGLPIATAAATGSGGGPGGSGR